MKSASTFGKLAIALSTLIAIYFLTRLSTIDFDESLYRSVSQSMKMKGDPWFMAWDTQPLFHKPPLFYWFVIAASFVIDFGKETISSMAARVPSLLSTLGVFISLWFGMRFLYPGSPKSRSHLAPLFALICALFPMLTSTSVIFDPFQTLALMPALLIPTRLFLRNENPTRGQWLGVGASLALATMIKGLNGILIPSFAIGLHLLFCYRAFGWTRILKLFTSFLTLSLAPAVILSTAFYFLLDHKIGRGFTDEFFWVQHFGRSRNPMEAHSGNFLYHPLVLFLGGGFLTPVLFYLGHERKPEWLKTGFPLTFAFSFVLFFSLSATKLPHYTWPAWPALALFVGIVSKLPAPSSHRTLPRAFGFLVSTPVFLLGSLLFFLSAAPDLLLKSIPLPLESSMLLSHLSPFGVLQKSLFFIGSMTCFVFLVNRRRLARSVEIAAFFSSLTLTCFVLSMAPSIQALLIKPFYDISEDLKALNPPAGECIRYSGPFSATLSLALGPTLPHNRCEPSDMKYLIAPEWKAGECEDLKFTRVSQRAHLVLCKK